jgi:four helix bundle protein
MNNTELPHQRLDSYKVAREICMRVYATKISNAQLRDQAERAASSMFLQLAEGLPIEGTGLRKKYFTESHASLHELVAALDLAAVSRFMNSEEPDPDVEHQARQHLRRLQPWAPPGQRESCGWTTRWSISRTP